jgi:hypothetical protein
MKKALIASLATSALVIGAFAMSASAYVFSNYLSVGSTGNDVVALQSFLVSKGFLTMPAGVAEGYFGSLTKAAVVAYQASVGLPSTGYVGPMTVKVLNAGGSTASTGAATCPAGYSCAPTTPVTFACPSGWTCTPLAGTTGGTVTGASTATGITTPGVEGILSATPGPVSNSVLNGGQLKAPIIDARLQAQDSDIAIQRVTVDLGASTNVFNYVFSNLYLVDPSTGAILTSTPLNASTVVQSGSNYVVNMTGFNFIVPKNTYKDLTVEADVNGSILTQFLGSYTVSIDNQGIRGVDGAGIDQYSSGVLSQSVTINQSLSLNSQVNISLDGSTPVTQSVPVIDTTNGNYLGLPVLTFDMLAQNDNIHIHNLTVKFASTTSAGNITAAYLYNGSTLVTSAAVASNGTAEFQNLPDSGTGSLVIPQNTTAILTVKADVTGVSAPDSVSASIPSFTNIGTVSAPIYSNGLTETFYNSTDGNANTIIGGATGNTVTVLGKGLNVNLAGTIGLSTSGSNSTIGGASPSTTTESITATIPVTLTAVGSNVYFGDQASTSPVFTFNVYDGNGNVIGQGTSGATITGYTSGSAVLPQTGLTITTGSTLTNNGLAAHTWELPQGSNVTLNPTFEISGRLANGVGGFSSYTIGLASVNYQTTYGTAATPLTFMASSTLWRSSSFSTN